MDISDSELLRLIQRGDSGALGMLYMRYSDRVRRFAMGFLQNEGDADDVTHDVFVTLWQQCAEIPDVASLKAYLFRMTRNAVFNAYKHRQVEYKYQAEAGAAESPATPQTDDRVSTADLLEMIDLAVRNMPEQRRRVFCMSRYENMSYNDIAEALNISPKTVQYHISGALAELRKLLSAMAFFI